MDWTTIEPMLAELITLVIVALIGYAVKLLKGWIIENRKQKQFVGAFKTAKGLWVLLEETLPMLVGEQKMEEMKAMLHVDFPLLSDSQLTAINKEVHLEMDKLYKELTGVAGDGAI